MIQEVGTMRTPHSARFILAAFLVVAAASLVFAGGAGEKPMAKSITIGAEAGGPYQLFYKDLAAKQFTPKTGITVNWVDVPHTDMHQKFLTEAASGAGAIDVFNADQPWVPEFAAAGYLVALDKYITADDKADILQTALDTVSYNGKIYALPYLVHDNVLYYRTDLLQKAGISAPPTTWAEYIADAQKLTGGDVYGTIVEGKQAGAASAKFLDIVYQAGGSVFDSHGNPAIDGAWIDAFNFYLDLIYTYKVVPPGSPTFDNADTHNLLIQGKLAMAPGWPYMFSMVRDPKISKVVGLVKVGEQPGKVKQTAAVFSWGFCVNTASKAQDAAASFLKFATSTDAIATLATTFINPAIRRSALDRMQKDPAISEADRNVIAAMTADVEHGRTIPMIPQWPRIDERIQWALSAVTSRQVTPEQAAAQLTNDIQGIMKK
jgi:ABC-type glycerol-3-phosphate transport system substrate-binding protein